MRFGRVALTLLLALPAAGAWAQERAAPVVVELFTSQGCSSCPPADALLGRLAREPGILALSFHVDYWNYLGWADPFSSKAATTRQRDYAMAMRQSGVYTPQIVVQGGRGVVGSDQYSVTAAIEDARKRRPTVEIELQNLPGRAVLATIAAAPAGKGADLWFILFDRQQSTRVLRGENEGKTLVYHHVVREFRNQGKLGGERIELTIPAAGEKGEARSGAALLAQHPKGGRILGAAVVSLDD